MTRPATFRQSDGIEVLFIPVLRSQCDRRAF